MLFYWPICLYAQLLAIYCIHMHYTSLWSVAFPFSVYPNNSISIIQFLFPNTSTYWTEGFFCRMQIAMITAMSLAVAFRVRARSLPSEVWTRSWHIWLACILTLYTSSLSHYYWIMPHKHATTHYIIFSCQIILFD